MLVIRLTRVGKKNSPAFRVVVADKHKAVKRKFIEIIGHYNPTMNPKELVIDKEKALHWISQGAQPSDTVNNLMVRLEILPKEKMIKKVFGKATKKKDEGKEAEKPKDESQKTEDKIESPEETIETAESPEDVAEAVEPEAETEPEAATEVAVEAETEEEAKTEDKKKA